MFKHCCKLLKSTDIKTIVSGRLSTTKVYNEKWDIVTAVCVERKPIITPPLNKLENDYKNLLSQIEFERSLKSDHEVRHEKEMKQMEQLKKGEDIEVHLKQTAQELVDAWTDELSKFKFAETVTEDDKKNVVKSLNRKLDKHLVLVVNQKLGEDNLYLLPQGFRQNGETLRQTAERVLKETCGNDIKTMIYGNAPASFYKYKYPKNVRMESKSVGAKVFIYFARYQKGEVQKQIDYKWLDRSELQKILPAEYQSSVAQMLIDE